MATKIQIQVRPRRRLPVLRVHGVLAPLTAMINLIILLVLIVWWTLKFTGIALYLGGRATYRAVGATRRRVHEVRYPKVTQEFHWSQEK